MSLRKIFCPNCGQETQIDDNKAFCFCLQCGNKIMLQTKTSDISAGKENDSSNMDIDKKLEEVAFYYKLSLDKKEYEKFDSEPMYYIKAQDILVDLSQIYPNDYRIWWELCKPIDFDNPLSDATVCDRYSINEDFFNKALDNAELSEKQLLVEEHDKYLEYKRTVKMEAERKCEEDRQRIERELQENKQKEAEERKAEVEHSKKLWTELSSQKYVLIDNTYFMFPEQNNQNIVGVFKMLSNTMYLIAFRIDGRKSNNVYREQTIAITFDGAGHGVKKDNSIVRIKSVTSSDEVLRISSDVEGRLYVNGMQLKYDDKYVSNIMKCAKKPMRSLGKIFI